MKLPSLVKLPKHRKFDFQPRHYDPVKEDLEQRVAKVRQEMGEDSAKRSANIRFERKVKNKKFSIGIQPYLVIFMLFDVFLLIKVDNLSNQAWGIILLFQALAVYLKVRLSKRNA